MLQVHPSAVEVGQLDRYAERQRTDNLGGRPRLFADWVMLTHVYPHMSEIEIFEYENGAYQVRLP